MRPIDPESAPFAPDMHVPAYDQNEPANHLNRSAGLPATCLFLRTYNETLEYFSRATEQREQTLLQERADLQDLVHAMTSRSTTEARATAALEDTLVRLRMARKVCSGDGHLPPGPTSPPSNPGSLQAITSTTTPSTPSPRRRPSMSAGAAAVDGDGGSIMEVSMHRGYERDESTPSRTVPRVQCVNGGKRGNTDRSIGYPQSRMAGSGSGWGPETRAEQTKTSSDDQRALEPEGGLTLAQAGTHHTRYDTHGLTGIRTRGPTPAREQGRAQTQACIDSETENGAHTHVRFTPSRKSARLARRLLETRMVAAGIQAQLWSEEVARETKETVARSGWWRRGERTPQELAENNRADRPLERAGGGQGAGVEITMRRSAAQTVTGTPAI